MKTTCDLLEEATKHADEEAKRAIETVKHANHLAEEIKRLKDIHES